MKQYLRSRVAITSGFVEIFISVLILSGILVVSIDLIKSLIVIVPDIFNQSVKFDYEVFLGSALQLIIGVEFVKMLAKHTPESTIEVLLFAIARKLIVDTSGNTDVIIGVIAIAILFTIKKFLYSPNLTDPRGFVLDGYTSIQEANFIAGASIPGEREDTIAMVMKNELEKLKGKIVEGSYIILDKVKLKVYSMQDETIDRIEVIPIKKRKK